LVVVESRRASTRWSRCGSKMKENGHGLMRRCARNFKASRNAAVMNSQKAVLYEMGRLC